jgi:hypothetical protein
MTFAERLRLQLRFKIWAPLRPNRHASYYSSHSQFGEDMVARAILGERKRGRYVDIGAHHPIYYSNTYHFYCSGWSGINIDALPGTVETFNLLRPRDTNLQACLSDVSGVEVTFYVFEQAALSTTDPELAKRRQANGDKLVAEHRLRTVTLPECLEPHLHGGEIDLLSIDIEGMVERILAANDWNRYRPRVLIFERGELSPPDISADPLVVRLTGIGYKVAGNCGPSIIMSRLD